MVAKILYILLGLSNITRLGDDKIMASEEKWF